MEINFLWVGDKISKLGKLTLVSFLKNDHTPILWLYNKNCQNIPDGVIKKDAGEILHPDKIFSYTGNGDCRKNSYGGFSDLFRYYLLYLNGGWYCDMDVTCIKNFEEISKTDYVIRPNEKTKIVANIIKTPKNNSFIKECIDETEKQINENNDRWIKPMEILTECFDKFNLNEYMVPDNFFGIDNIETLKNYLSENFYKKKFELPKYAIHWCNEAVTTGQWNHEIKRDWEYPIPTTLYFKFLKKYDLI